MMVQNEWEIMILSHAAFSERAAEKGEAGRKIRQTSVKKLFKTGDSDFQIYFFLSSTASRSAGFAYQGRWFFLLSALEEQAGVE